MGYRWFLILSMCFVPAMSSAQDFRDLYLRYNEAVQEADFDRAFDLAKAAYDAAGAEYGRSTYLAVACYNLALMEKVHNDHDSAIEHFSESAEIFEEVHGKTSDRLVDPLWELGLLLARGRDPAKAVEIFERLDDIVDSIEGIDPEVRFRLNVDMSRAYLANADFRRAERWLGRARGLIPEFADDPALQRARLAVDHGKIWLAQRDFRRARSELEKAVAAMEGQLSETDLDLQLARGLLVLVLEQLGEGDESTPHLVKLGAARAELQEGASEMTPVFMPALTSPNPPAREGGEGYAIIEMTVTADGHVADPVVVESDLDGNSVEVALEAVRQFRYAPRVIDGRPVATPGVRYRFEFSASDG